MFEICKYEECTGCGACANICGHSAISIEPDEYGFIHPIIATDLCTNCGVCIKTCPNNKELIFTFPLSSFAGCANDAEEQLTSTSGGIASVLSRHIIRNGGIVYGCNGIDSLNVHHCRIETDDEVDTIKGSKYVQSTIGDTYGLIRKDLLNGKTVLFIGTPCQVAGLLSFMPRRLQANLLTVDFVCHGVPSQQMLSETLKLHLGEVSNDNTLNFRIKKWRKNSFSKYKIVNRLFIQDCPPEKNYRTQYGLFVFKNEKILINCPFPNNDYIAGFLTGLLYRDSCYFCHYSRPERVSDITLGDYHFDKPKHRSINGENRLLSKIIINSDKGQNLLSQIGSIISLVEIDYNSLLRGNSQLSTPMKKHPYRDAFLAKYRFLGISILPEYIKYDKKRIKRHLLISKIRNNIYSLPIIGLILNFLRK